MGRRSTGWQPGRETLDRLYGNESTIGRHHPMSPTPGSVFYRARPALPLSLAAQRPGLLEAMRPRHTVVPRNYQGPVPINTRGL